MYMYLHSARKNAITNERHLYDVEHMDQTTQNSTNCYRIQQPLTVITRVDVHERFCSEREIAGFCALVYFVDRHLYVLSSFLMLVRQFVFSFLCCYIAVSFGWWHSEIYRYNAIRWYSEVSWRECSKLINPSVILTVLQCWKGFPSSRSDCRSLLGYKSAD